MGKTIHCPKFLKLSRDILRSVDATKWHGAELLGLFSRIIFWTDLGFLNELHNILRNSLWFCSHIIDVVSRFPTPFDQNNSVKYIVHLKFLLWDSNLQPPNTQYPALPTWPLTYVISVSPHPIRLHTVRHSPHYIAEVTFQNVEPTEFVFWYGKMVFV